jgi:hypothetical protein
MIYFENDLRAILILSLFDTALIQSLTDFDSINICVGENEHRTTIFKKDSLSAKLSKNIFMCDNFEDLMVRVQTFLAYPGNKKHTLDQLFAMVPYSNAVVAQYVKRFKSVFCDVVRMRAHGFGDVTFNVGDVKVDAEIELAQKDLRNKHCGTHFLEVPSLPVIPANCPSDNHKFE